MKKINSKQKGVRGERELAGILRGHGYDCRRTQQYCGNTGEADDVIGLDGIHIECKRVEKLNVDKAVEQAVNDCKDDKKPTIFHRKDRKKWLVTMLLEDWIELYREWDSGNKLDERGKG